MITVEERRLWRQELFNVELPATDELTAEQWWNACPHWYRENGFVSDPLEGLLLDGRRRPRP